MIVYLQKDFHRINAN